MRSLYKEKAVLF